MAILRCLKLIAAVATGCLTGVTHANAYDYRIFQYGLNSRVEYVHMHTVSSICHDVEWSEANWPTGKPIDLSSSTACLVDSVDVRTANGTTFHWGGGGSSAPGSTSTTTKMRIPSSRGNPRCVPKHG